jgi:hypothetical protein
MMFSLPSPPSPLPSLGEGCRGEGVINNLSLFLQIFDILSELKSNYLRKERIRIHDRKHTQFDP